MDLDEQIAQLREKADRLRKQLQVHTSTLLAKTELDSDGSDDSDTKKLADLARTHKAHLQQSLYRAGASVTAFRVHDPDPHAVDHGRVLGLRFDVVLGGQFLRPYYVFLVGGGSGTRQQRRQQQLRIHRHTVPASIPLGALGRLLREQDLSVFCRSVRRALVRYHNRLAVVADLRRVGARQHLDVRGADAAAHHVQLNWMSRERGSDSEKTGRLVVDDDGHLVEAVVVSGNEVRDRAAVRELVGDAKTAGEVVRRLGG